MSCACCGNIELDDVELCPTRRTAKRCLARRKVARSGSAFSGIVGARYRRRRDRPKAAAGRLEFRAPVAGAGQSFRQRTATLVDIGSGTSDADYAGKDLRGKLVLTSSQPGSVVERAVGDLGAAGIISYAPNQRSAWWKEDDRLVRWGHLESFPNTKSFGFMISLGQARRFQQRLASGEEILLEAKVDASHQTGSYGFATAAIAALIEPMRTYTLPAILITRGRVPMTMRQVVFPFWKRREL